MVDKERSKVEQRLQYKLEQFNLKVSFYILNHISEHVTLVQLMDLLGNVNHTVSVVGSGFLIITTK